MTTYNAVNTTLFGQTGTGAFAGSNSPTIRTPILTDSNGVTNLIMGAPQTSPVNYLQIFSNTATLNPVLGAAGSDTDIGITLLSQGAGIHHIVSEEANIPISFFNGTLSQHRTNFSFANTPENRTVTFQDSDGTVAWTTDIAVVGPEGTIQRSNGTAWVASTATFTDTYDVNTLLYAGSANAVSGLPTLNSASLSTNSSGIPTWLSLTDGQLVIGSTAGSPAAANLTAGPGMLITNASNSITLSVATGGLSWSTIAGTTQAATVNTGYVIGNAAQTTVTLPTNFAVGEVVVIKGFGAGGWVLQANTGDTIVYGQNTTSAGGTLTSAGNFDTVYVTGIVANTTWSVDYAQTTGLSYA